MIKKNYFFFGSALLLAVYRLFAFTYLDASIIFKFFSFKQISQLSAVGGIWYFLQSGQNRHRLHLESPFRMSLKHVLQVSNLAVLACGVGPFCVFAQSLQSLSEFRVSLKWQTLQTYFGLH